MFNCRIIIPRDTLYNPLFKSEFLPELWAQISWDPVIGFVQSYPCLGGLVLEFIDEKRLGGFIHWVPRYLRSKFGYEF